MLSESELIYERRKLYEVMREHPGWSLRAYARAIQHDLKWVGKWAQRLAGVKLSGVNETHFHSQSRRLHHRPKRMAEYVKDK